MNSAERKDLYPGIPAGRKELLLKEVAKAIEEIKFGSILITIHDSKVVQIERTEKMRSAHLPEGI